MKCEREFTWAVAARPHAADLAPSPPSHQPRFAVHAIDALVVHMLSCLIEHDLEPPVAPARLLPRRDPIEWTHPGTCEAISFAAVRGGTSMKIATVKQVFQVHAADSEGRPVLRKRLQRDQVAEFFANVPPCVVRLEACCGSHYWTRVLSRFGHTVKLVWAILWRREPPSSTAFNSLH